MITLIDKPCLMTHFAKKFDEERKYCIYIFNEKKARLSLEQIILDKT